MRKCAQKFINFGRIFIKTGQFLVNFFFTSICRIHLLMLVFLKDQIHILLGFFFYLVDLKEPIFGCSE